MAPAARSRKILVPHPLARASGSLDTKPSPAVTHADLPAHLAWCLRGGYAHCGVERAFGRLDRGAQGRLVGRFGHSLWQLLEHLRVCQRDLIDYSTTPGHASPDFPGGLWPDEPDPPTAAAYDEALAAFLADREELCGLIGAAGADGLLAPFAHTGGDDGGPHTLLRTATIALDHQAYHAGQAVAVRKALGCWPG